jgi:hypothetical protein
LWADLRAIQLLGVEVQHATSEAELTLPRPAGTVLLRFAGASEVTIHRPTGTAARVQVAGGGGASCSTAMTRPPGGWSTRRAGG